MDLAYVTLASLVSIALVTRRMWKDLKNTSRTAPILPHNLCALTEAHASVENAFASEDAVNNFLMFN